jgi:hypothetical protein
MPITYIDAVVQFILSPFFAIGTLYTRLLNRALGLDHFFVRGDQICQGFLRVRNINIDKVRTWRVIMEMGVNLIGFELNDGTRLMWSDHDRKLENLLRKTIPEREFEPLIGGVDM